MNTRRICTALLTTLAVAAPPRAQDTERTMSEKLLERLEAVTGRLEQGALGSETRDELRDLMDMLREQLGTAQGQAGSASETYRKAVELFDLGKVQDQTLKAVQGLQGTLKLDSGALAGQLGKLSTSLKLGKVAQNLKDLGGNLQGSQGTILQNLLRDAQDPARKEAVEKALEAVRAALDSVPDDTVNDILETVRKAIQGASGSAGAAQQYLRATGLYRALGEGTSGALGYARARQEAQEGAQQSEESWQEQLESARKQWEEQTEKAREQWREYVEEGRKDLEEQLQRALESYRRALERRGGTGEERPFSFSGTGRAFFPSGTETYTLPEGSAFGITRDPETSGWKVTTPGSGFVFGGSKSVWTVQDPDSGSFFLGEPGEGWRAFTVPEGEEGKVWGYIKSPEGEGAQGSWRAFTVPEGEEGKVQGYIKTSEDGESREEPTYLDLFKQDRREGSVREEEPQEIEELEIAELPELEIAEIPEMELAEIPGIELVEPTAEGRISEMVEDLRKEMQEIRTLVQTLRQRVKDSNERQ